MSHVFTYGSLMFPKVWAGVVGGHYAGVAAALSGFKRQRVLGQDYPSLQRIDIGGGGIGPGAVGDPVHDDGTSGTVNVIGTVNTVGTVDGIVYLGVEPEDLTALDLFEGPEYRRIQVQVTVREQAAGGPAAGTVLLADTYLFTADDKVESGHWDPHDFERNRIEFFLRSYPPPRSS